MSSFEITLLYLTTGVVCGFAGYYLGWSKGAAWMRSCMHQIWLEERESKR
jgi:hypothetical protein